MTDSGTTVVSRLPKAGISASASGPGRRRATAGGRVSRPAAGTWPAGERLAGSPVAALLTVAGCVLAPLSVVAM